MTFDSIRERAIDEQQASSFPDVRVSKKGEPCVWPFRRTPERILLSMLDSMKCDHSRYVDLNQKKKRRRHRGPRVLVASYLKSHVPPEK
jgi:hypothetical protein